jgi:hypothetical protein
LGFILGDAGRTAQLRSRLSSISWFMRLLCEPLAKLANREDHCTGHFWEGRFKSQALLDEAALLACSVYVELNPIRAGIAETPETSDFTSVQQRIAALASGLEPARSELAARLVESQLAAAAPVEVNAPRMDAYEPIASPPGVHASPGLDAEVAPDGWLSPVPLADQPNWLAESSSSSSCSAGGRRASDRGFLPLSLLEYLQLIDWTGRQLRRGKRGSIAADAPPILQRLGIDGTNWLWGIESLGRLFRSAIGRASALADFASARGRRWLQGVSAARLTFG